MNSPFAFCFPSAAGLVRLRALWLCTALCLPFSLPVGAQPAQPDLAPFDQGADGSVANSLTDSPRQAERDLARSMMDNPRNPLLEIVTSEGDLYLELFQEAAPRNTALVLELAQTVKEPSPAAPTSRRAVASIPPQQPAYYYDGFGFTATGADVYIELGDLVTSDPSTSDPAISNFSMEGPQGPMASAPDEINGRGLGLEQQPLLDAAGRPHPWLNVADESDFQRKVLVPLYRSMGITDRAQLESEQDAVMRRLQQMNLMQVYEMMGYRYNAQLASRRPVSNSVLMSNHGPGTNNGGLVITLADTPWLTGTHTVVGRLVSGQAIARLISRQPPDSIRIQQLRYVDESP